MTISRISRNGKHAANGSSGARGFLLKAAAGDGPVEFAPGLTAEKTWLTPELAKQLLSRMRPDQRKQKKPHLASIREDILGGLWVFNCQPILVDTNNDLADGAHRCHAVIQTGIAVEVVIIRGVPVPAFSSIDNSTKRTGSDAIATLFPTMPNTAASSLKLWSIYTAGAPLYDNRVVSPQKIHEVAVQNLGMERSIIFCRASKRQPGFFPGAMAFCHYAFSSIDKEDADTFIGQILHGENIKKGDPAFAMRNRLISDRGALNEYDFIHGCFRAWMYFRKGEQLQVWRSVASNSPLPEIS